MAATTCAGVGPATEEEVYEDLLPVIACRLGSAGLMSELRAGFRLLADPALGAITAESLRRGAAAVLGLEGITAQEAAAMMREGDADGDDALSEFEFCVLMVRLSPGIMEDAKALLEEAIAAELAPSSPPPQQHWETEDQEEYQSQALQPKTLESTQDAPSDLIFLNFPQGPKTIDTLAESSDTAPQADNITSVVDPAAITFSASAVDSSLTTIATAAPRASLPAEIRDRLVEIQQRLDISIDSLVSNAGPIRSRFVEIQAWLPNDLLEALQLVSYIEFHQLPVLRARQRMSDRAAQEELRAAATTADQQAQEEQAKFDALTTKPADVQRHLEKLRQERDNLQAALEAKEKEIQLEEARLASLPGEIQQQQEAVALAKDQALQRHNAIKPILGSDEDDAALLAGVDGIRLNAINVIWQYL